MAIINEYWQSMKRKMVSLCIVDRNANNTNYHICDFSHIVDFK